MSYFSPFDGRVSSAIASDSLPALYKIMIEKLPYIRPVAKEFDILPEAWENIDELVEEINYLKEMVKHLEKLMHKKYNLG